MSRRRWIDARRTRPGRSHSKVRADHAMETAQDYVEAVSDIVHRKGECRVRDLADHMGVSHVTVSRIVSRLLEQELLQTAPYRPIRLTAKGEQLAAESRRCHGVVFRFLLALGVPEAVAGPEAEGIEHHVGPETLNRMDQFVKQQPAPQ